MSTVSEFPTPGLDLIAGAVAGRRWAPHWLLVGRNLGRSLQKPSTRTRVSFEVGIAQLGGTGLYLAAGDLRLGRGETIRDMA